MNFPALAAAIKTPFKDPSSANFQASPGSCMAAELRLGTPGQYGNQKGFGVIHNGMFDYWTIYFLYKEQFGFPCIDSVLESSFEQSFQVTGLPVCMLSIHEFCVKSRHPVAKLKRVGTRSSEIFATTPGFRDFWDTWEGHIQNIWKICCWLWSLLSPYYILFRVPYVKKTWKKYPFIAVIWKAKSDSRPSSTVTVPFLVWPTFTICLFKSVFRLLMAALPVFDNGIGKWPSQGLSLKK